MSNSLARSHGDHRSELSSLEKPLSVRFRRCNQAHKLIHVWTSCKIKVENSKLVEYLGEIENGKKIINN